MTSLIFLNISWAADFPIISTEELKAKLDAGTKLILVYPLSDIEFNQGHIPGSINIPLPEIKAPGKLPQDKETLVVMY
jgi:rhodanese-related sulfurtransferase